MKSTLTSFPIIDLPLPGTIAFSTLRGCNDPDSPYDGFNACHYTGDSPCHVAGCREAASNRLGLTSPGRLLIPRQTHSANIAVVNSNSISSPLENIDGLVTTDRSIGLGISTADCVPVLLCDAEAGVLAAVHSGWRGTVKRIAAGAVEAMKRLGADPGRIRCILGPYIHLDAFEVGNELIEIFDNEFGRDSQLWSIVGGKAHIDLGRAVALVLTDSGVNPHNIADCGMCSFTSYSQLFSARRLGISSGRTLTAARLHRSNASI